MANIRLIRGRIKSAKNIAQITKAMELVAASKMRRAQAQAMAGKLYANKIYEMVMRLSSRVDYKNHPLLARSGDITGKRLVIVISTNKGLCGGLNTNLFRFMHETYKTDSAKLEYATLGKKGAEHLTRLGNTIVVDFSQAAVFTEVVPALNDYVSKEFIDGHYDTVELVYSEFISALKQSPKKKTILPLSIDASAGEPSAAHEPSYEFLIEPSVEEVFQHLLPHYLENQIRDAVLQAEASEHSARMVAMRNATDNADGLADDLTLVYNKARQEKITYEITDMVTARLAVE